MRVTPKAPHSAFAAISWLYGDVGFAENTGGLYPSVRSYKGGQNLIAGILSTPVRYKEFGLRYGVYRCVRARKK